MIQKIFHGILIFRLNMICDLPKLKQLDLTSISANEKRDVGLEVSSDEEDDKEEEVEINYERGKFSRAIVIARWSLCKTLL